MELYITMGICFIPLIVAISVSLVKVTGFTKRLALVSSLLGLAAIIPIGFLQFFILELPIFNTGTISALLVTTIIFNGLIEEFIKMLLLLFLPAKKMNFKAFLACAIISGLALGCFEAIIYVITGTPHIEVRLFTAVIMHAACAGLSGLYVWTYKNTKSQLSAFITAVLLHGIYNFFAGFSGNFWLFSIVAILFAIVRCRVDYHAIDENLNK